MHQNRQRSSLRIIFYSISVISTKNLTIMASLVIVVCMLELFTVA